MMLLQRHYIKEFLKLFALLAAGLSLTFSLFGLIQRLDDFMPHSPSAFKLLGYAVLKTPQYALSLMPVACLLCSLYVVSHAAKARETVAFMAAGGRMRRLLMPFLWAGALLSLGAFALGEFVAPPANVKAQEIKDDITGGVGARVPTLFREGVLWFRAEDGSIVKIENYISEEDAYGGVSVFKLNGGGLSETVEARSAAYLPDAGTWKLTGVRLYKAGAGESAEMEDLLYPGLGSPEMLKETARKPADMGAADLYRYVRRLGKAGFRNLRLTVDLHSKVSYPLINLIMVLIGVSFPVRRNIGGVVATAIGLLISLAYWLGFTMSLTLGYAGILPPVAAAWLMPLAAGSAGIYLYRKIPE